MKHIVIILFAFMCIAQWYIPGKMIYDSEVTLTDGTLYKFKTRPIDPSDPFRGKYVTLSFDAETLRMSNASDWKAGEEIYIEFTTDTKGFAIPASGHRKAPASQSYLRTYISSLQRFDQDVEVAFKLPFNRLYLEESKAPEAERLYWQSLSDSTKITYAVVSIGKGSAVLQDVYINDRRIVDIINDIDESTE
jgi:uncharacterized membrane-anchored protein